VTKYSGFHKLSYHDVSVVKDCNPGKLHHKVFILDNRTVITGSFNPSNNADTNNEENLVIIRDAKIAEKYIKEFHRVTILCTT